MSAITEEDLLFCIKNTKIKYKDRYVDYPFQKISISCLKRNC